MTASPHATVVQRPALGVLLMAAAVVCYAGIDTVAKWLTQDYAMPQIVWVRYVVHLVLVLLCVGPVMGMRLFRTRQLPLQLLRGLLHVTTLSLAVAGLSFLPIADQIAITYVYPLLVTALAVPILGEKVGTRRWAAVAIGFVGTLVIIRPGSAVFTWAALLPIAMAVAFALYLIATRYLGASDHPMTTLFYMAAVGAVTFAAVAPFFWRPPTGAGFMLMVLMGILGGVSHLLTIFAFRYAEASLLSPLGYTSLIWGTIAGYTVFDHLPDAWTIAGAGVVAASGIYVSYRESRVRPG
ncbi:MAG: DMT family transporter [Alphaproteobacteria bacterium]|nr:DMT family transporter [Alphaproteobacteria bacterium]